jgi:hypothetical protein
VEVAKQPKAAVLARRLHLCSRLDLSYLLSDLKCKWVEAESDETLRASVSNELRMAASATGWWPFFSDNEPIPYSRMLVQVGNRLTQGFNKKCPYSEETASGLERQIEDYIFDRATDLARKYLKKKSSKHIQTPDQFIASEVCGMALPSLSSLPGVIGETISAGVVLPANIVIAESNTRKLSLAICRLVVIRKSDDAKSEL